MKTNRCCLLVMCVLIPMGCRSILIDRTDQHIRALIESHQYSGLGFASDASVGAETGKLDGDRQMYQFSPNPLNADLPSPFDRKPDVEVSPPEEAAAKPAADGPEEDADEAASDMIETDELMSPRVFSDEQMARAQVFGLDDALAYAMRHGRDFQNAKEDLYLAALALSLERHLWTPQFSAIVQANYTDFGEDAVLDRALSTTAEVAVTQQLPLGGTVTARVIHSMVREISELVSRGEGGQFILEAEIPLLRGAGRVAYESRYDAERALVYAVRTYERFRRTFLVSIARDFFDLQRLKAAIANTYRSYLDRHRDWFQAEFKHRMGRSLFISEAPRARTNFRDTEAALVSAKARYESSLDRFKIRLGMAVVDILDVVDQEKDESAQAVDRLLVAISEEDAVDLAVKFRLDLLNNADRVDDVRRGVVIAKNQILPDLGLSGGVTFDSDPDQLRSANLRDERAQWEGQVRFQMDDRKRERNAYRSALIDVRRAERSHREFLDSVRADVRRALRGVRQQSDLRRILAANFGENEIRLEGARARFNLGQSTNQEVVDAENDVLSAANQLAAAIASYRVAILEFRRDTGTLRVSDSGQWALPDKLARPAEVEGVEP